MSFLVYFVEQVNPSEDYITETNFVQSVKCKREKKLLQKYREFFKKYQKTSVNSVKFFKKIVNDVYKISQGFRTDAEIEIEDEDFPSYINFAGETSVRFSHADENSGKIFVKGTETGVILDYDKLLGKYFGILRGEIIKYRLWYVRYKEYNKRIKYNMEEQIRKNEEAIEILNKAQLEIEYKAPAVMINITLDYYADILRTAVDSLLTNHIDYEPMDKFNAPRAKNYLEYMIATRYYLLEEMDSEEIKKLYPTALENAQTNWGKKIIGYMLQHYWKIKTTKTKDYPYRKYTYITANTILIDSDEEEQKYHEEEKQYASHDLAMLEARELLMLAHHYLYNPDSDDDEEIWQPRTIAQIMGDNFVPPRYRSTALNTDQFTNRLLNEGRVQTLIGESCGACGNDDVDLYCNFDPDCYAHRHLPMCMVCWTQWLKNNQRYCPVCRKEYRN